MIRADLARVRDLAEQVSHGLTPFEVSAGVRELAAGGPLRSLRMNCLYHCRFVHAHHGGESHLLFPAVRAAHPDRAAVLDRLESEHVEVAGLLHRVEAAAGGLVRADGPGARRRVVDALTALSELLLAHLDYEEEQLGPLLRTWDGWPFGH